MATELIIKAWCDVCLADDENTPGETITVPPLFGESGFDIELCNNHALSLRIPIAEYRPFGRAVGKGAPRTPGRENKSADYRHPSPGTCPECGHASPSMGAMRAHLLNNHGKSLADVGLAAAREACPECGSKFPNKQGLAAHFRISHPDEWAARKQPA